jgi:hypothetical protein
MSDVVSPRADTYDWGTFDRVMREERRAAVLVRPERVYSNAG